MATAAFKSTSRRPNSSSSSSPSFASSLKDTTSPPNSSSSSNKPPPRRSRSVSAVPRSHTDSSSLSSSSDYLIKRDNPLYWSNVSPPDKDISQDLPSVRKSSPADDRRGRSVSRNHDSRSKDASRVLPKVDTGRRRSVSRGPDCRTQPLSTQSDAEGVNLLARYRNGSDSDSSASRKNNAERSDVHNTLDQVKSLPVSPRDSPIKLPNFGWADKVFGSSFPEADKRCAQKKSRQEFGLEDDASSCIYETVRSEVRLAIADIKNDLERAIVRSNATTSADIVNLPPDLVNPGAIELVLDIRREYSRKLEQSLERARKLREELEVEEHRGLELKRILKEVLPDPKNSNMRRSRQGRKSSIERRKMSNRLTEEAIAYFDECISLSTFDSSDFDSQDEPPISIVGNNAHIGDCTSLAEANTSVATTHPDYKQESDTTSRDILGITARISKQQTIDGTSMGNIETRRDPMLRFSFAQNRHQIELPIQEYVKNVGEMPKSSMWDIEEYNLRASSESFLFDTLLLKNKIESGTILLCGGGGITISLSPYAYVI